MNVAKSLNDDILPKLKRSTLRPQSAISSKLFVALGFIAITTIFAGTVSIFALQRFQENFNTLIDKNLPTLADTARINQLSATVADRGAALIISPNTWTRTTIVGQVDDDVEWLEEVLNRIPEKALSANRRSELFDLKSTLLETYKNLNVLTENRIKDVSRLVEIKQHMVQIQKDLVLAQSHVTVAQAGSSQGGLIRKWHMTIHDIIFKLMQGLDEKHTFPLQRLKIDLDIRIDDVHAQISKLPLSLQRKASTRLARINAITLGPNGLFAVKKHLLETINKVQATLAGARTTAERFVIASKLATRDVQQSIAEINTKTRESMSLTLKFMVGFILISAIIAITTFLYVSRTVLLRLSNLRISMLAHADGSVQKIDTSGGDEITDMAKSLQYLVDTLHTRETGLFDAVKEAEHASKAKTRFLAAASHDLRQPLQALNLFVYALESREQDPDKLEIIELIRNSLDSLKELLNTLLDISKLEAGVVQATLKDFAANDIIKRIRHEMTDVAWAKDIELRTVETTAYIHSDPSLLGTVVRNLLDNAIKYTEVGKVLIGCRVRGSYLRFEVWDTGPGFLDHQKELIFQDFYQIDNAARKRTHGLGLGLSIVKRTTELLDCTLGCRSVMDKGSMFWVDVPLSNTSKQDLERQDQAVLMVEHNMMHGNAHIVIFEDDDQVLLGLKSVLENHHYTTLCFSSAQRHLIQKALKDQQLKPDLIIADYRLEGQVTGVEAISILQNLVGKDIPGIIITGDTAPERLREAKKSGFPILHKPIRPEELLEMVHHKLSKGPAPQNADDTKTL
ncbi:MAG: response regulator [Magnetovibrio sp.]|nr:response regulator [Magnetovibrio sp.]